MKKIVLLATVMILAGMIANAQVGTDKELHVPIAKYQTYTWTSDINMIPSSSVFIGPNNVLIFNNPSTRNRLKQAIQYELGARDYRMSQSNPDFLVGFDVLEQPADLVTYNGYKMLYNGLDSTRTNENVGKTHVEAGTVMIKFVDAKSGEQVWQGFNSGALNPGMANNDQKIRAAISEIFRQYKYTAQR
ncbi:MAG TPA: DUF4136 domain-containing protein [Flavisolibacter sp.]|nr:DUF4136 domain-containing protein [Flavisolibacter sp.]